MKKQVLHLPVVFELACLQRVAVSMSVNDLDVDVHEQFSPVSIALKPAFSACTTSRSVSSFFLTDLYKALVSEACEWHTKPYRRLSGAG